MKRQDPYHTRSPASQVRPPFQRHISRFCRIPLLASVLPAQFDAFFTFPCSSLDVSVACEMARVSVNRKPMANSATPRALAPITEILMLRRSAASASILSMPTPFKLIAFNPCAVSSTLALTGSTPANIPTQPGNKRSNSSSFGCSPGVEDNVISCGF